MTPSYYYYSRAHGHADGITVLLVVVATIAVMVGIMAAVVWWDKRHP